MQIIGFNFTKISAEKKSEFKQDENINTNIEFINLEKEKIELLKDFEPIKLTFKFLVTYGNPEKKDNEEIKAEVSFEGNIILSTNKDESKEILKSWKKKELPNNFRLNIFNTILRKCSIKSLQLEEDLNLPHHVPLPALKLEKKD